MMEYCDFGPEALVGYKEIIDKNTLTTRSMDRLAKVARTIADLEASTQIQPSQVQRASSYVVGGILRDQFGSKVRGYRIRPSICGNSHQDSRLRSIHSQRSASTPETCGGKVTYFRNAHPKSSISRSCTRARNEIRADRLGISPWIRQESRGVALPRLQGRTQPASGRREWLIVVSIPFRLGRENVT